MSKPYDLAVVIGRFQPLHNGHIHLINEATKIAKNVVVLLGSSHQARSAKNPFTYFERAKMIMRSTPLRGKSIECRPIRDHLYNDGAWCTEVQTQVEKSTDHLDEYPQSIVVVGHRKDASSYYLSMFPNWSYVEVTFNDMYPFDATRIRDEFFNLKTHDPYYAVEGQRYMPEYVLDQLEKIRNDKPQWYLDLVEENTFVNDYKKKTRGNAPYPVQFITADAVVVQSGHILLVQRRASPGKGLWACPGGYVNVHETVKDACIRELREETKIAVPAPVLVGSITREKRYDHPFRSQRGRILTTAFKIELTGPSLPKVKGSDDAAKAKWIPFVDFLAMEDKMFEDHFYMICDMCGLTAF